MNLDGKMIWMLCEVKEYDEERKRFLVFMNNMEKERWVSRSNLLF